MPTEKIFFPGTANYYGANAYILRELGDKDFELVNKPQGHSVIGGIVIRDDGDGPVSLEQKWGFGTSHSRPGGTLIL